MKPNRREFFGGGLAIVAASIMPAQADPGPPVVVGDGVHDDTAGLNALLSGKEARIGNELLRIAQGGELRLAGQFLISSSLIFGSGISLKMEEPGRIIASERFDGAAIIVLQRPELSASDPGVMSNVFWSDTDWP